MKKIIATLILGLITINGFSQDITGVWTGSVVSQLAGGYIVFNFTIEKKDTSYYSLIDIPGMGAANLRTLQTTFVNGVLKVDGSNMGFIYEGKYEKDSQQIVGTFTEGANMSNLILKRATSEIKQVPDTKNLTASVDRDPGTVEITCRVQNHMSTISELCWNMEVELAPLLGIVISNNRQLYKIGCIY